MGMEKGFGKRTVVAYLLFPTTRACKGDDI
jgi:hypothetical protein